MHCHTSLQTSRARFILSILALTLTLPVHVNADDVSIRHCLWLAEYGKGPNRLLELDADGQFVGNTRASKTRAMPSG